MALDNQFGKGIGLAAGFDLGAQKPLDSRVAVNTIAERDAHIENNRAYEGMLVYVAETGMTYQLVQGAEGLDWKEFGFNQADFDDSFAASIKEVDDRLKEVEADLAQGGEIEARIAQNESDIDGLQGLVGQPAEGENDPTGLHLAVKNAQDQADKGVADAAAEKLRAEGQEAAIRQELADEAAEIRGEVEDLGEAIRGEMEEAHGAIEEAMQQAHEEMNGAMEDAVKAEQDRAVEEEGKIRGEMAVEAARVDKKIADDIAAESALRVAEEQRIEKALEDAIAKEVEDRDAAIEVEKLRAEGKEGELLAAINKEIEDREGAVQDLADKHDQEMEAAAEQVGKDLAALKEELQGEIDGDVAAEAALRDAADKALDERVKPLEAHVAAQPGVDEVQDNRIKALEDDAPVKQAAIEAAQAAADKAQGEVDVVEGRALALEGRMEAVEEDIARIDGAVEVEGSIKKQIKDAIDEVNGAAEELEGRVEDLEGRMDAAEAEEAQIRLDFAAEDVRVLGEAKDYADQQITALVDSAPDAMNTLNELAKAINDNKGIYDAWVIEHNQAMADLKEELQGEIDQDVKVVADELAKQKDAAQEGTLAKQIADEVARAQGQEAAIRGEVEAAINKEVGDRNAAIEVEKLRAEGQEQAIRGELADAIAQEVEDRNAAILEEANRAKGEEQRIEGALNDAIAQEVIDRNAAIKVEADRAVEEEGKIREELAGAIAQEVIDRNAAIKVEADRAVAKEGELLEAINKEVQDRIDAVQGLADRHDEEMEALEGKVGEDLAALKSELQKEIDDDVKVEADRAVAEEAKIRGEFAAADEALHGIIKGEMAAVIQSLVAEITEDGMLRIALGGNDDVLVIREQEIPFVTDEEIDEIIAGLDN